MHDLVLYELRCVKACSRGTCSCEHFYGIRVKRSLRVLQGVCTVGSSKTELQAMS